MHKKLMMASMTIAAVAVFVIAPAASASPVLTDPLGTPVVVGASITDSSSSATFTGSNGVNVVCHNVSMPGNVMSNNGSLIEGRIPKDAAKFTGTGTSGDCTSSLGSVGVTMNSELCFKTVKGTDNVEVTGGCGTNEVTFTLNVTGVVSCAYKGNITSGATFKTNADAEVNVLNGQKGASEIPLESGGFFCPSAERLDMESDLTTTNGATIFVS